MDFYSAFATPQELVVRYQGRTVGSLSALYMPQPDDHFLLGGRRWQVAEVDLRQGEILVRPAVGRKPPKFVGSSGEIHNRIREEMQRIVATDDAFEYLDAAGRGFLADARSAYRRAGGIESQFISVGDRTCLWFTWTGTRVQRTLMMLADRAKLQATDRRIAIEFAGSPESIASALIDAVERVGSSEDLAEGVPMTGWRKFDGYLAEELLRRSFVHDWLDLPKARAKIDDLRSFAFSSGLLSRSKPCIPAEFGGGADTSRSIAGSRVPDFDTRTSPVATSPATGQTDRPLADCEFIAFDLETTGLHPLWSRIVEIGAVRFRSDGTELARYHELVDPGCEIPPTVSRLHGITDSMVAGKPKVDEVLPRFFSFVGHPSTILLAHNAGFDHAFVRTAATTHQLELPSNSVIDTLPLAERLLPAFGSLRLESLAKHFGLSVAGMHRAITDCLLLKAVFLRLLTCGPNPRTARELMSLSLPFALNCTTSEAFVLPPGFETLAEAIEERRTVQLLYRSSGRGPAIREITPLAVTESGGRYYLSAKCHLDGMVKTFRLDRIERFIVVE